MQVSKIETIKSLEEDEDEESKLYSVVVKDFKVKTNECSEISNCGIVFVVVTGNFDIKNPPLKMYYEGLALCLEKIVQQVTPKVNTTNLFLQLQFIP